MSKMAELCIYRPSWIGLVVCLKHIITVIFCNAHSSARWDFQSYHYPIIYRAINETFLFPYKELYRNAKKGKHINVQSTKNAAHS